MSVIFDFMRRQIEPLPASRVARTSSVPLSTVQRWKAASSNHNETLESVEAILASQGFEIAVQGEQLTIRQRHPRAPR